MFQATVLKFGDLLGGWKLTKSVIFQFIISKITPVGPKNTGKWGVNTTIAIYLGHLLEV